MKLMLIMFDNTNKKSKTNSDFCVKKSLICWTNN